jgi:hypothetical protein
LETSCWQLTTKARRTWIYMMQQNFYSKANNYFFPCEVASSARKKNLCQVALLNASQCLVIRTDNRQLNNLY